MDNSGFGRMRSRAAVALAVAGVSAGMLAPASADAKAKKAKPLTKAQVIALIKQYGKGIAGPTGPAGPVGPKGDTGPAAPAIAAGAGLSLNTSTNTLSISPTLFGQCGAGQFVSSFSANGIACTTPPDLQTETEDASGGFTEPSSPYLAAGVPDTSTFATVGKVSPTIASTSVPPGTSSYIITADIHFEVVSSSLDTCRLYDQTTSTALDTESVITQQWGNLVLEDVADVAGGDQIAVQCESGSASDLAGATLILTSTSEVF